MEQLWNKKEQLWIKKVNKHINLCVLESELKERDDRNDVDDNNDRIWNMLEFNNTDKCGLSNLLWAVQSKSEKSVRLLLNNPVISGDIKLIKEALRVNKKYKNKVIRRLLKKARNLIYAVNGALRRASDYGNVNMFKELFEKWGLTSNDVRGLTSVKIHDNMVDLLKEASRRGDVNSLKELRENWGLTSDDARAENNKAIMTASYRGHVNILKELRKNWGLTGDDARDQDNQAIKHASYFGHVNILKELRENWGLTSDDARAEDNQAIKHASEMGRVNILKELRENWGLTSDDARAENNKAIRLASEMGHVNILKELRENWGLTSDDARAENNYAIWKASRWPHVNFLKELRNWGLTSDDFREAGAIRWWNKIIKEEKRAFTMGLHKRVGEDSSISTSLQSSDMYDPNLLGEIFNYLD